MAPRTKNQKATVLKSTTFFDRGLLRKTARFIGRLFKRQLHFVTENLTKIFGVKKSMSLILPLWRPKRLTEVQRLKETDASQKQEEETVAEEPVKDLAWLKAKVEMLTTITDTMKEELDRTRREELTLMQKNAELEETHMARELHLSKCKDDLQEKFKKRNQSLKAAEIEVQKLRCANQEEQNKVKQIHILEDEKKAKTLIEKEIKQADQYRKKMLKAQADLEKQEQDADEPQPWKFCEICGQEYTEEEERSPRVLNCGHTMCLSCIVESADGPDGICCPFDRKYTPVKIDKIGEQLPKNYAILHM